MHTHLVPKPNCPITSLLQPLIDTMEEGKGLVTTNVSSYLCTPSLLPYYIIGYITHVIQPWPIGVYYRYTCKCTPACEDDIITPRPHLGVWEVPLGLRGKGMVSCVCYACRVSVAACNVCVDACACTCGCKCKCDNVHSCMDTCTCMCSSAHSCGCVADGGDAMAAF